MGRKRRLNLLVKNTWMAQADREVDRRALKSACPYAATAAVAAAESSQTETTFISLWGVEEEYHRYYVT
eukprot:COSAG06_NODE_12446_length_1380_cov_30.705699_2_plen_69_part_00